MLRVRVLSRECMHASKERGSSWPWGPAPLIPHLSPSRPTFESVYSGTGCVTVGSDSTSLGFRRSGRMNPPGAGGGWGCLSLPAPGGTHSVQALSGPTVCGSCGAICG